MPCRPWNPRGTTSVIFGRVGYDHGYTERAQSQEERHIIVLRCEDVPLRGPLAASIRTS
jgi:hypothetical protein